MSSRTWFTTCAGAERLDEGLGREIKDAVRSLETIQVRDLMALLAQVSSRIERAFSGYCSVD